MERTTSLCDALLAHVQDRAVADVVFSRSSGGRPHEAVSPVGGLSDELALKHYKGDPKKAITAVMATQSPTVLAKFSKDPRVNVRRAVAASPYITPETATYLHDWAVKRDDGETLEIVLPKTPWSVALNAAPEAQARRGHPWAALAASIAASGSVEAYEAARRYNNPALSIHLVKHLVTEPPAGYGLPAYLEGYSASEVANLLSHASQEVRTLTAEFASLMDAVSDEFVADAPIRGRRRVSRLLPNVQRAEKDAIPVVLGSSLEPLWVALAGTDVAPSVIHRLIEKGSSEVAEVLVRQRHRSLTTLMGEKLAPAVAAGGQVWAITALLKEPKVKLSSEATLLLLRAGTLEVLTEWLLGEFPHKPQPGEFRALVADPKDAFSLYSSRGYYYRQRGVENPALPEIARRLSGHLERIAKKPWGSEVVDALQGEFFSLVRTGHPMSRYLVERLERAFGAEVALWETALTLADSWNNGLTELLEASFLTTGEIPPSMGQLSPVIEEPVVTFGQMEMPFSV